MAKTKNTAKENPQLLQRKLASGKSALYLEFYDGREQKPRLDADGNQMYYPEGTKMAGKPMYIVTHHRHQEQLKLYLLDKPRTPEEKEFNRVTLAKARSIRNEREQQRLEGSKGYRLKNQTNNLFAYFDEYIETYEKKDLRNIKLAVNRFKTFIREDRRLSYCAVRKSATEISRIQEDWAESHKDINGHHPINENAYYNFTMSPELLDRALVERFKDYLIRVSNGEGAATCYKRFKKIISSAVEHSFINTNPCNAVKCPPVDKDAITKDILTAEEINALVSCHYDGENPQIRNAFVFTLCTGTRFCDVVALRYSNVDYQKSEISFTQKKTDGHSAHADVTIPLRPDLLNMIGTPSENGKDVDDLLFDLPSHTMCLKALRRWTSRAGIDKHITWHCGRHSFATQILTAGANVKTVASLLGHSGLNHINKYVRAVDSAKAAAVNSLNIKL